MDRRQLIFRGAAMAFAAPTLRAPAAHAAPPSGQLPARAEIIAVLRRVADQWINGHSDSGDNGWARATFFSGLMAVYRLTRDARYLTYTRAWAERHNYGINGGVTTRHADNHNAIQAYLDLYEIEPEARKLTASEDTLRHMITDQPGKDDDWWWVDALHMAMPPFARFSRLRNDDAFAAKLYRLYNHTKRVQGGPGLWAPTLGGLWYRDDRFLPGGILSPGGKPVLWSRGNGWAAAGHVKVLKVMPPTAPNVPEYRDTLTRLVTTLRPVQRGDGFWNVNLGDATHLPGPETSGTSFFAYGTAYAIAAGLVPSATYLPVAARAWNGLVATAVHPDGFLGYVQNVGDRPESSQPVTYDSTADFGVGAFLLAGTELAGLVS
ncbi:glycoside hydrolase family 88 protein [Streptomyces sp. W16]|uniref:glycoside hydrolase family 88 protein n=1 Tax=Streptomyces sp. W16 TaxID=3076631 RepID=UPI00295B1157|nr:glycoside hydrolase family 88 protein [Streptomyces sp. W16]MDV9169005.1 glycoside hydrolase family 88 protein [Streptomyces sp. W16]